eukprot:TRINITY_DN8932_c0_g1_i5.p1 TRINITY_DN8932_c0_g1~~TRINITY_DN8932_c0_g1_i5.p1  ORF type:complete len:304 (+),score=34.45 TRINITY_DN8932_c0_g1_i5:28-912(+)
MADDFVAGLAILLIVVVIFNVVRIIIKRLGGESGTSTSASKSFQTIGDNYTSLDSVTEALRKAGLESSNLILAIDYTKSNLTQGQRTFKNQSLHHLDPEHENPYQTAIRVLGSTLAAFDDDDLIPAFGFGDVTTQGRSCFPFFPNRSCYGFSEVLTRYSEITSSIRLSGPTNFAPVIQKALDIVRETRSYHILVILADGQVTSRRDTINAIVEASNYPLSIIMVGVGDGPWQDMHHFDDQLPARKFDNFQFVEFHEVMTKAKYPEPAFALTALMEIPEQYKVIRSLDLLSEFPN